jgi:hypothetical protein
MLGRKKLIDSTLVIVLHNGEQKIERTGDAADSIS